MKLDPWKHKEKYLKWKEKVKREGCIKGISKTNSDLILKYIFDMEIGINIATGSVKGSRSPLRLNSLKQGMTFLSKKFEEHYDVQNISNLTDNQVVEFFARIKNGDIKKLNGETYKSAVDFINIFKAFWHWHIKVNKKEGIKILDITDELDCSTEKPDWVYLNETETKKMFDSAKRKYKVLIMFLFDTGIRAPTELMNIKVSDFYNDFKELNIRNEIAKKGSFGRKIKLMLCSDLIREFIEENNLERDDHVFQICPPVVNRYLKRLAKRLFGEKKTLAGQRYCDITMYDFRHISCCYWLPRYKSESALKFRFGWKKSDKIHYYSEMLGMRDTIQEDDMLVDITKTEIEKQLIASENEKKVMQERMMAMEQQLTTVMELVRRGQIAKERLIKVKY